MYQIFLKMFPLDYTEKVDGTRLYGLFIKGEKPGTTSRYLWEQVMHVRLVSKILPLPLKAFRKCKGRE